MIKLPVACFSTVSFVFIIFISSRGESAALGHFSVYIFFGQVDNKESKTKYSVASQYNSLALFTIKIFLVSQTNLYV